MPLASISRDKPIEYSMIHSARSAGPAIGTYAGEEIYESIVDEFGRLFYFTGIAPRRLDGGFAAEALKPGEFILQPGLVYRLAAFVERAAA
jgi:hypothetical protein